jgi:hypothetical protein
MDECNTIIKYVLRQRGEGEGEPVRQQRQCRSGFDGMYSQVSEINGTKPTNRNMHSLM